MPTNVGCAAKAEVSGYRSASGVGAILLPGLVFRDQWSLNVSEGEHQTS